MLAMATLAGHLRNRLMLFTLVIMFLATSCIVSADISGNVQTQEGESISASVLVYNETRLIYSTQTDGVFSFELPRGKFTVILFSDDPETPGFDYLPVALAVDGEYSGEVVLEPAASLILDGDFQYVDTESIPLKTVAQVLDDGHETLLSNGFPLKFSDKKEPVYEVKSLPNMEVIVPADTVISLNVTNIIILDTSIIQRSFLIEDQATPGHGEALSVDVRKYTIPISRTLSDETLNLLETQFTEMNQFGFYLARQETALSNGIEYLRDSDIQYNSGDYEASFDSLKHGYILFTHTSDELNNMYLDAKVSVYTLIAFLALASIVTGYLLFDDLIQQAITDMLILGASLIFFYYAYPGSKTIPLTSFILSSAGYLSLFLGLGVMFPRIFTQGGSGGRVLTRNLIAPIFNLARRSLRRRKVRFFLTFISLTLLVMSFVTLTSFSEGYGLITGEAQPKSGWIGVYIREGTWSTTDPSYIVLDEAEYDWLMGQPEVMTESSKAESRPLTYPLLNVLGNNIYGIIGVDAAENQFVDLKGIIIEGVLPSNNSVLISEQFAQETGLSTSSKFTINLNKYTVSGLFSDQALTQLKDIDGTPYVPMTWQNINPDGDIPNYVLSEVEPQDVLIMDTDTALKLPLMGIQRIAFKINPGYNETGFAERLALERGYLSWANTEDAYTSYRLGNYFQGKGATLIIPWIIVVLNVVVTMLNNLYERRKEIEILSSVGLNPAQVSAIFVAEAAITGFIAGGLGYLVGLGFYKALAILNIGLQVHQKVSAVWSLAAIGLAISAVVTGAFAALRNSVVITPSLMRRWKIDVSSGGYQDPWTIDIPIKLDPSEVEVYLDYVEMKLQALKTHPLYITSSIKTGVEDGKRTISFVYKAVQTTTGNFYTRNTLYVVPTENGEYGVYLESYGETEWSHEAGSLIRRITVDYSTEKKG